VHEKIGEKCVCVFIPTTPDPTSGFLIIVPVDKVTKLDMSVAEGFKYIISLGALRRNRRTTCQKINRQMTPMDADAKAGGQNSIRVHPCPSVVKYD